MKPPPFDYALVDTVESAVEHLHNAGDEAKLLAGGQSLVPLLNYRLARPAMLIDVNRIPRLADIVVDDDVLRVGALARHRRLETSSTIATQMPILSDAAGWIAHPQIRTRGTIGGSVAHADASAELPVVLSALDATATVRSPRQRRQVPVRDIAVSHFLSSLEPDEMIVEFQIPRLPRRAGSAFTEFARRHGDYAIGGSACVLVFDDAGTCVRARIVVLGGGPTPVRCEAAEAALVGSAVTSADSRSAGDAARLEVNPMTTTDSSSAYRQQVIATMVHRSINTAAARARSAS